jgi:hypothetical protein
MTGRPTSRVGTADSGMAWICRSPGLPSDPPARGQLRVQVIDRTRNCHAGDEPISTRMVLMR